MSLMQCGLFVHVLIVCEISVSPSGWDPCNHFCQIPSLPRSPLTPFSQGPCRRRESMYNCESFPERRTGPATHTLFIAARANRERGCSQLLGLLSLRNQGNTPFCSHYYRIGELIKYARSVNGMAQEASGGYAWHCPFWCTLETCTPATSVTHPYVNNVPSRG